MNHESYPGITPLYLEQKIPKRCLCIGSTQDALVLKLNVYRDFRKQKCVITLILGVTIASKKWRGGVVGPMDVESLHTLDWTCF